MQSLPQVQLEDRNRLHSFPSFLACSILSIVEQVFENSSFAESNNFIIICICISPSKHRNEGLR